MSKINLFSGHNLENRPDLTKYFGVYKRKVL